MKLSSLLVAAAFLSVCSLGLAADWPKPDLTVAADGSGDFKSLQAAVASIPRYNHERRVVLIKNGVYAEKIRMDSSFITLRGESRQKTRLEFAQTEEENPTNKPDASGRGALNLNGNDCILENLTVENTANVSDRHTFAVFAKGDRNILLGCTFISKGADTVAMWPSRTNHCYYLNCSFRGARDVLCPRGWCYAVDCDIFATDPTAAVWHEGSKDPDMKFVLRNCKFDGAQPFCLGRHQRDAQFYFLDCAFSKNLTNRPLARTDFTDPKRSAGTEKAPRWGERSYYYHCHRDGGDYPWFQDNLASAPGNPAPDQFTAAWTLAGKWDPEVTAGPAIEKLIGAKDLVGVVFNEAVTVKGKPFLTLKDGMKAEYASGSGLRTLQFRMPAGASAEVKALELNGGAIIASEATRTLRLANLDLPKQ